MFGYLSFSDLLTDKYLYFSPLLKTPVHLKYRTDLYAARTSSTVHVHTSDTVIRDGTPNISYPSSENK